MPSEFIVNQAEILHSSEDVFLVLQNLRDKYTVSSFPSQMTRVKEEWYKYKDYHPSYETAYASGLKYLKKQGISRKFLDQYKEFGEDPMKMKIQKQRAAYRGSLTGSTRADQTISELPILPEFMKDYKLTKTDSINNSELSSKSIETRSKDCVEVGDCDALIDKCRRIVKKLEEDPFVIVAALGVLCGRRSVEILKTGKFLPGNIGSYSCVFSGMAKKRHGTSVEKENVPLLVKFKYINPCLEHIRIRINVSDMTNTQVNAKYSHKLGDAAKILLESLNVRFHDLRAIYGTVSHQVFENNWSINIWLKRVLIHETLDTSLFYSRCKVEKCNLNLGKWEDKSP